MAYVYPVGIPLVLQAQNPMVKTYRKLGDDIVSNEFNFNPALLDNDLDDSKGLAEATSDILTVEEDLENISFDFEEVLLASLEKPASKLEEDIGKAVSDIGKAERALDGIEKKSNHKNLPVLSLRQTVGQVPLLAILPSLKSTLEILKQSILNIANSLPIPRVNKNHLKLNNNNHDLKKLFVSFDSKSLDNTIRLLKEHLDESQNIETEMILHFLGLDKPNSPLNTICKIFSLIINLDKENCLESTEELIPLLLHPNKEVRKEAADAFDTAAEYACECMLEETNIDTKIKFQLGLEKIVHIVKNINLPKDIATKVNKTLQKIDLALRKNLKQIKNYFTDSFETRITDPFISKQLEEIINRLSGNMSITDIAKRIKQIQLLLINGETNSFTPEDKASPFKPNISGLRQETEFSLPL